MYCILIVQQYMLLFKEIKTFN